MGSRTRAIALASVTMAALGAPSGAFAATKTVFAGTPPNWSKLATKALGAKFVKQYSPDVNDFFLHRVTIHVGDRVSFVTTGFHTVDLPGRSGQDVPLFTSGSIVSGVKDAAGQPFWFNGKVRNVAFNPALLGPSGGTTYDGSKRVNSGLPFGPPKPLNVTFTKAGTYKYFCDAHPGMIGYVVVKPKGQPIPTAKQDAAALAAQVKKDLALAKKIAKTRVGRDQVSLGQASSGVELYAMFPSTLKVKTGTVVTFFMPRKSAEVHTATFGPKAYLTSLADRLISGGKLAAEGVYPSEPRQPIPLTPKTHGNGFANTGALDRDPSTPLPPSGRIRFAQPGVYHFICLIHPEMQGTVVVTK